MLKYEAKFKSKHNNRLHEKVVEDNSLLFTDNEVDSTVLIGTLGSL
jgi:hypothetical protein